MNRALFSILVVALCARAAPPAAAAGLKSKGKNLQAPRAASVERFQPLLKKGLEQMSSQDYSAAITSFDRATQANSGSAEAFFRLGDAYYHRAFERGTAQADPNDAGQAVAAFETALVLDPGLRNLSDPYMLHHGMAMSFVAMRKYDEALGELRKAMAVSPGNPMPAVYAAQIRLKMNDPALSTANLQLSIQRARKLNSYPALARLLKTDNNFSDLMSVPQNRALLEEYDDVQGGRISEEQARDRVQEDATPRDALRDSVANAPTLASQSGSYRGFASRDRDPSILEHLNKGHEEFRYGHHQNAITEYRAALDADQYRGSLDSAQKSLLFENLGTSYRLLGQIEEAVGTLESAVKALPQNSSAYYQLALAYAGTGRAQKALSALDNAFRNARNVGELRKTLLLAKTDVEFDAFRSSPAFQRILMPNQDRVRAAR
ncbi:MAG: tetratricopeptide repeat protein [Elusimicrobia bacterium]|nr:tetratricopeptide repeat protein [Elusimicrobiota bacterium]